MTRAIVLAGVSMWAAASALSASQTSPAPGNRSTWEGVYTLQQAKRGQEQYDISCANCHGSDMQGDGADVPALGDERFAKKWDRRTLKDLFSLMSQTMPENRPGSLSKEAYGNLLAYILQGNGFPNGVVELSRESDELARIVFDLTPPEPR
jgi:mono/diheme cytochrome c family protein